MELHRDLQTNRRVYGELLFFDNEGPLMARELSLVNQKIRCCKY